jgi:hypothetical protein
MAIDTRDKLIAALAAGQWQIVAMIEGAREAA